MSPQHRCASTSNACPAQDSFRHRDPIPRRCSRSTYANQYDHAPLQARPGERVRIWVLAAGPDRGSASHVVGGQFDTVYREGSFELRPGAAAPASGQVLGLSPAQGGFVELTFLEPGPSPSSPTRWRTPSVAPRHRARHPLTVPDPPAGTTAVPVRAVAARTAVADLVG